MANDDQPGVAGRDDSSAERADSAREGVVSARQRFQRLSEEVQERYHDVSEDVRRGAERASAELRRGAGAARERYESAAESARQGYDRLRRDTGNVTSQVNDYVRENPGKSVLIAAGVGFLLGMIVRRRDTDA